MKCKCSCVLGAAILVGMSALLARGEPPPQDSDSAHRRAGCPQAVVFWAQPSNTVADIGYYVGGGRLFRRHAEGRSPQEGTWGWDYSGRFFQRRVELLWWHGRRYQGGTGRYETDGPHLPHLDDGKDDHRVHSDDH